MIDDVGVAPGLGRKVDLSLRTASAGDQPLFSRRRRRAGVARQAAGCAPATAAS